VATEICDFDPLNYIDERKTHRLDRYSQFAIAASKHALCDAALNGSCFERETTAVYLGSALGGIAFAEQQHEQFLSRGIKAAAPMLALAVFGGAGATNVSIEFGINGPVIGNANSCASGVVAIGEAFRLIRSGGAPLALTGGAEAPLAPLTFGAFSVIKAMTTHNSDPEHACRPFDRDRDGFVMGEGAAVVILEELQHALKRGVRPYAEVLGYGLTNDAYHMTEPLPSAKQAARAIELALDDARVSPKQIGYVNAHATGTPMGDAAEAAAIRLALRKHAETVYVSGTKGLHGHPLGATGAIETAITALALDRGWLPPTANLVSPDSACELNHVPSCGQPINIEYAIKNSFGFGGINASLVLGRWQP
jgi:3-oxoacyl-[acyl-carrier-protein] synthase II